MGARASFKRAKILIKMSLMTIQTSMIDRAIFKGDFKKIVNRLKGTELSTVSI
mgnify:CR=1 FL=1